MGYASEADCQSATQQAASLRYVAGACGLQGLRSAVLSNWLISHL